MSSLVILRSWSDGKPPIVRGIAKDSDKDGVELKPDRQGQFVAEEVKKDAALRPIQKLKSNYNKFGISQFKFWNKDVYKYGHGASKSGNSGSGHSGSASASASSASASPSPPIRSCSSRTGSIDSGGFSDGVGGGGVASLRSNFERISLSRESSVPSLAASPIEGTGSGSGSPPSSPLNSRYKNLGPELAATIPRRQIFRKSWIRDHSLLRKEMSKSTPSLNSISSGPTPNPYSAKVAVASHSHSQNQDELSLSCVVEEVTATATAAAAAATVTGPNSDPVPRSSSGPAHNEQRLLLKRSTSTGLNSHNHNHNHTGTDTKKRPLSYADSLFVDNDLLEPTFGDKPASVVGVIKKDPRRNSVPVPVYFEISPDHPVQDPVQDPVQEDTFVHLVQQPKIIARQNKPQKVEPSASAECVEIVNEQHLGGFEVEEEFTVHCVSHDQAKPEPEPEPEPDDGNHWISSSCSDDAEDNDNDNDNGVESESELKALVDEDEEDEDLVLGAVNSGQEVKGGRGRRHQEPEPEPKPVNMNSVGKNERLISFSDRCKVFKQGSDSRSVTDDDEENCPGMFSQVVGHEYGLGRLSVVEGQKVFELEPEQDPRFQNREQFEEIRNGAGAIIAHAQVPIQCVNEHVLIPEPYRKSPGSGSENEQPVSVSNRDLNQNGQFQFQRNVQRRKNFCDELLNDNVVLRVPLGGSGAQARSQNLSPVSAPAAPPTMTPPPVPRSPGAKSVTRIESPQSEPAVAAAATCTLNHDGIIFFDEEDEFEQELSVQSEDVEQQLELDRATMSERETSFEYMSVCHNSSAKARSPDNCSSPNNTHSTLISTRLGSGSGPGTLAEIQKRVGIDVGSSYARICVTSTAKNDAYGSISDTIQIQDACRAITTSDGLSHGHKSLAHSMSTKSKLIYKWRPISSSSPSPSLLLLFDDLYGGMRNDEEFSQTLEVFFTHYAKKMADSETSRCRFGSSPSPSSSPVPVPVPVPAVSGSKTQWNFAIIAGMDKKIVRELAYNTGLVQPNDELRLVNESTAAAVTAYEYLKCLKKSTFRPRKTGKSSCCLLSINIGSTFIHTSAYEMMDGRLNVISSPESQMYQSPEIQLIELLSRIFSPEFILKYESRFTPAWIQLLVRFDEMKNAYYGQDSKPYLWLPISFYIEFFKFTGMQVPECLEDNEEEGLAWDNNGAIQFDKSLLNEWVSQPIISLFKSKLEPYDNVVLSGGGVSDYLLGQFQREFTNVNVVKVPSPENAVIHGLVNLDRVKITFKSPFSIGVGVMTPFDDKIHPKEKCVTRNGKKWCSDVWDNLIRKSQLLTVGETLLKRTYVGAQPGQNVLVLPIFKSYNDEPKLVTCPTVEKCCELRFEIGKEKSWREVQLIIKCYESELAVIASGTDGIINQVSIDF